MRRASELIIICVKLIKKRLWTLKISEWKISHLSNKMVSNDKINIPEMMLYPLQMKLARC